MQVVDQMVIDLVAEHERLIDGVWGAVIAFFGELEACLADVTHERVPRFEYLRQNGEILVKIVDKESVALALLVTVR